MPESNVPPSLIQKGSKPPGLLPKHTQTYLLAGLALLMVIVIAFSGKNPPKPRGTSLPAQTMSVVDPNAARIQEYRERIEEQTRKLQLEQAQLSANKQALSIAAPTGPGPAAMPAAAARPYESFHAPPAASGEGNALASEEAKREYESRFASNIALTYRKDMAQSVAPNAMPDYRALANAYNSLYAPALAAASAGWPMTAPPGPLPGASAPAAQSATVWRVCGNNGCGAQER